MKVMALTFLVLLNVFIVSTCKKADPDGAFGVAGKVITAVGNGDDVIQDMALQSDGRIVVCGYSARNTQNDIALARYLPSGVIDDEFGQKGLVTADISSFNDIAYALEITSEGQIYVAGSTQSSSKQRFFLARYLVQGVTDNSFDRDGFVAAELGSSDAFGTDIVIQQDGKILVSGYTTGGSREEMALVRFETSGALDTTFNASGKLLISVENENSRAEAMALQPDGKIVLAGFSGKKPTLVRVNTDGTLDSTFGQSGKRTLSLQPKGSSGIIHALGVLGTGAIVAAGEKTIDSSQDVFFAKLSSSGALDTSFATDGQLTLDIDSSMDTIHAILPMGDGKIHWVGDTTKTNSDFFVVRMEAIGTLDPFFASRGKAVIDFNSGNDRALAAVLQSDGKVVVGGASVGASATSLDFALARLNSDGSLDSE